MVAQSSDIACCFFSSTSTWPMVNPIPVSRQLIMRAPTSLIQRLLTDCAFRKISLLPNRRDWHSVVRRARLSRIITIYYVLVPCTVYEEVYPLTLHVMPEGHTRPICFFSPEPAYSVGFVLAAQLICFCGRVWRFDCKFRVLLTRSTTL